MRNIYFSLKQENKQLKDKLSKIETLIINHNCDTGDIYYKYNSKFLKSELKQRILEILYGKAVIGMSRLVKIVDNKYVQIEECRNPNLCFNTSEYDDFEDYCTLRETFDPFEMFYENQELKKNMKMQ